MVFLTNTMHLMYAYIFRLNEWNINNLHLQLEKIL